VVPLDAATGSSSSSSNSTLAAGGPMGSAVPASPALGWPLSRPSTAPAAAGGRQAGAAQLMPKAVHLLSCATLAGGFLSPRAAACTCLLLPSGRRQ
jgi:hypothetical protein